MINHVNATTLNTHYATTTTHITTTTHTHLEPLGQRDEKRVVVGQVQLQLAQLRKALHSVRCGVSSVLSVLSGAVCQLSFTGR